MDFEFTEEQEEIRKQVRALCARFPDEYWRERDESGEFPWEFYKAIASGGWLGVTIPKEYGGAGLGITEAAIVMQTVAESGAVKNGDSLPRHDDNFAPAESFCIIGIFITQPLRCCVCLYVADEIAFQPERR